jgi:uncharacterized oxidoreductase
MPTYPEDKWRKLGFEMVKASVVSDDEAETIVDVLVTGSLLGIDSHGVNALPSFIHKKAKTDMKILKELPAITILDANGAWGPYSAKKAMEKAIEKAKTQGIAACSVVNGEWITNLSYFSMLAVKNDMIGLVFAREGPVCVPWGGKEPVTGTNPMSIGIPAGNRYPIVVDFATTIVAQGHVKKFLIEGKPLPEGWLINRQGHPIKGYDLTLEGLNEFWKTGGALLPFGTYKGYGINVAIDLICGALTLSGTGLRAKGQGLLMIALDIRAFVTLEEFKEEVDQLIVEIKASPVMSGFQEILLPGEREYRMMEKRKREGIPVHEKIWQEILETCNKLQIDAQSIME